MPTNVRENEFLLRCACYSYDHQAMLVHEPDDSRGNNLKGQDDDWYLSVMLTEHGLWRRVKNALWYVLRPSRLRYGMYAEVVLRNEDVEALVEFVRRRRAERTDATT